MTRFSKLVMGKDGAPVETEVREIAQSAIGKCPHCILFPEHYRDDGSCKCDDPKATLMREWGYRWSARLGRWN